MTWRIYKHTDPGAPSSDFGTRGNLAAVLRACLITGYGSGSDEKTPVGGWSEPFTEANNIAVFRADSGNRQFYQIDDASNSSVNVAILKAYESMSDITTGDGQWADTYFGKRCTAAQGEAWVVVANQTTVVMFFGAQHGWMPFVFGEYQSLWGADSYNNMVAGFYYPGQLYSYSYNAIMNSTTSVDKEYRNKNYLFLHRLPDGTGLGLQARTYSIKDLFPDKGQSNQRVDPINTTFANLRPLLYRPLMACIPNTASPSDGDFYNRACVWGFIPLIQGVVGVPVDTTTERHPLLSWSDNGVDYLLLPAEANYDYDSPYSNPRACFALDLTEVN